MKTHHDDCNLRLVHYRSMYAHLGTQSTAHVEHLYSASAGVTAYSPVPEET